jgi:hypothetical protein
VSNFFPFSDKILVEQNTDALLLAPNNVALSANVTGQDVQHDLMRNAYGAPNIESGSSRRHIADGAIKSSIAKLNRSGLKNSLS